MKKHIGFVSLDSSLDRWIWEKPPRELPGAEELAEGLQELLDGRSGSLILEMGEGTPPSGAGIPSAVEPCPSICGCGG